MIEQKGTLKNIALYGAFTYSFLLPLSQKLATYGIAIWVITSLIQLKRERLNKNIFLVFLPILYLIYVASLLLSENQSLYFLEHKLSLVAFPLLFFLNKYSEIEKKKMMDYFIFGLLTASTICFLSALFNSIEYTEGALNFQANLEQGRGFFESSIYGGNYFFGQDFSIFHQTVYFSIYLCTGVSLLVFDFCVAARKYRWGLVVFFLAMLFLVSNKAGFVVLAFLFLIKLIYLRRSIAAKTFLLAVGILILSVLVYFNPRFKNSFDKIVNWEIRLDKEARYDYKIRLLNWDASAELIKKEPIWGYGVGDAQRKLNDIYLEKGYTTPLKNEHNAHNQFLQIFLESGLIGFVWLTIIYLMMFIVSIGSKSKSAFLISIATILLLSALFESIFNRFSGISFFSFIACLVFFESKGK